MEDDAGGKLTNLLDSLPQSANKLATIEKISVVLSAVTPASLRTIVPNLSFNTVFECLGFCSRYAFRQVIVTFWLCIRVAKSTWTFCHSTAGNPVTLITTIKLLAYVAPISEIRKKRRTMDHGAMDHYRATQLHEVVVNED